MRERTDKKLMRHGQPLATVARAFSKQCPYPVSNLSPQCFRTALSTKGYHAPRIRLHDADCLIPMNASIGGNALATVVDGKEVIVYDRELSPLVVSDGAEMIIAHELGHITVDIWASQ